ncbi:hypothetical protein [Burkholderia sp. AU4i]|uniref:hypothetical protein n=1 Tax=Burkholderia sp. AU4i TaxID=1335308 RepID=UPI0012DC44CC|nr:hypothetical protein [Burkholderia sp. AU4i]
MSLFKGWRDRQTRGQDVGRDTKAAQMKALEDVFGRTAEALRAGFPAALDLAGRQDLPLYPKAVYLGDCGVNAFVQHQNMEINAFPRFLSAVREGGEEVDFLFYRRGDFVSLVRFNDELAGRNVWLLTNDVELMVRLALSRFSPPPPWVAWCEHGPFVTYNQGAPEYWYHNIWEPFWSSLTLEEQDQYIEARGVEVRSYLSDEEWEDWVYTTRRSDPRFRNEA